MTMLFSFLLKLVRKVAVLMLVAMAVSFGVRLVAPLLSIVLDGIEFTHYYLFLKLRLSKK